MASLPSAQEANNQSPLEIHFLRQGEPAMHTSKRPPAKILTPGAVWKMEVDLGRQLQFPQEICSTTLRPYVVLWSVAEKSLILTELTMGGGTGSCLREKEGEVCRPVRRVQRKWMECEAVPSGGGSQKLCGQINIMPAKEPGTTGSHTEQIHKRVL